MKPNESETKIHFNGSFIIAPHSNTQTLNTHRGTERIPTDLGHRVNPCFFSYKHSWDTFQSAARERSEEKEREWVNLKIPTKFDYKICCEGINWEF